MLSIKIENVQTVEKKTVKLKLGYLKSLIKLINTRQTYQEKRQNENFGI